MSISVIILSSTVIILLTAGDDYIGVNKILSFPEGVSNRTLDIKILDDLGQPVLEGPEMYQLVLRMPMGGSLGQPKAATVIIDDTISDGLLIYHDIL